MKILQGIYDNLISYYSNPANLTPASTSQPSAPAKKISAWSWFKRSTASPAASTGSAPLAAVPEVKNTGTNYTVIHSPEASAQVQTFSAPKGLYLWGGPGCGKTYLMDLLYNSLQTDKIRKARVDFHSFMLEIHMKLHQFRQKYGRFLEWGRWQARAATRCRTSRAASQSGITSSSSTNSRSPTWPMR